MAWPQSVLPIKVELAFGSSLADGLLPDTAWTDVSADLLRQEVAIQRGRSDENSRTAPGSCSFELDNPHGHYTPDDPRSPFWPHVVQGTPCRISLDLDDAPAPPTLQLPGVLGAFVSTPYESALGITGDIDIRVELEPETWQPGDGQYRTIIARWSYTAAHGDWSWILYLGPDGAPRFSWSTDGTSEGRHTVRASEVLDADRGRLGLRATLNTDDGDGNHVVTFATAPTIGGDWIPLGEAVVNEGATSIHEGTADLAIGATADGRAAFNNGRMLTATIDAAEVYDGIDGELVADPEFTGVESGNRTFTDDTGHTWTLHGGAVIAAPVHGRFYGSVDAWTPAWPYGDLADPEHTESQPGEARVSLTVSGILRRLGQGQDPLQSTLARRVPSYEPVAYWPMEDGKSSEGLYSPIGGVHPLKLAGFNLADSDDVAGSAPLPKTNTAATSMSANVPPAASGDWEVGMVCQFDELPASTVTALRVLTTSDPWGAARVEVGNFEGSPTVRVWVENLDAETEASLTYNTIPDSFIGAPIRIQLASDPTQAGSDATYIRARITRINGGFADYGGNALEYTAGSRVTGIRTAFGAAAEGILTVGHVAVFDSITGFDDAFGHADHGYNGEPASIRIQRLCTEQDIPIKIIGGHADTSPLGPQRVATLLDLLREAAAADGGTLSETRDFYGLLYRTRASRYNQRPRLRLDAAANQITPPLAPVLDDQQIRNDITISRPGGSAARAIDDESIARSGRYTDSIELNVAADDQLQGKADWRLHLGTWPGMRYPRIATDLAAAPEVAPDWLGIDTGDRLQVDHLPPQHPAGEIDLIIEGYAERLTPTLWTAEMNCTPGGPWLVGVWNGDADDLHHVDGTVSRYDTAGTRTLFDFEAGSDIYLDINTHTGPAWTDDPEDFPFEITAAGVRLRVTAAGSPSSSGSQVLTVEATPVNDITRTIPADTPVLLAQPARYAL